jgi:hypothetical protein
MKKSFLMALACVITLASFANHKEKGAKHAKKASTTVCPGTCHKGTCTHS